MPPAHPLQDGLALNLLNSVGLAKVSSLRKAAVWVEEKGL